MRCSASCIFLSYTCVEPASDGDSTGVAFTLYTFGRDIELSTEADIASMFKPSSGDSLFDVTERSECSCAIGDTLSRSEERPTLDGPTPDPGALAPADRAPDRAGLLTECEFTEFAALFMVFAARAAEDAVAAHTGTGAPESHLSLLPQRRLVAGAGARNRLGPASACLLATKSLSAESLLVSLVHDFLEPEQDALTTDCFVMRPDVRESASGGGGHVCD